MICRRKTDNRMTLTCPFHGWTFRNDGTLLKVKDPDGAGYPATFDVDGSHNMTKVARFDSYRGFLFGSINDDVLPLDEHLGDTTKVIDMLVDQSPDGLEVLRGSSTYTYDGNWKVQAENGADGYHVTATHWNYAATTSRRGTGESKNDTKALDAGGWGKSGGGYWSYPHGHLCLWTWAANPQDRPLWDKLDELKASFGDAKGEFMVKGSRNLCLYPNVYVMDQFSTQIRHFRPIAPDKTEVTIYCIAPKGESDSARTHRIRQYEDFFNASGHGHPRRPRGVPVLPAHVPCRGRTVERHEPRRGALGHRTRRRRSLTGHGRRHLSGREERGRGPLPGAARLLAGHHASRIGPRAREGELR